MNEAGDSGAGTLAGSRDIEQRPTGRPLEPARPDPPGSPPTGNAPAPGPTTMTLVDHLSELRKRVAISILVVLVFSG
ncbi:MAG: hypothetical protein ACC726_16895, partial [Chloroflexota bacterium]